uniref:Tumor necrosis factor receptor superfamily member 10B n=1 Tax=Microcebus murinus TaxID=30608 RepID=A0A8C5YKQ8_MICMU
KISNKQANFTTLGARKRRNITYGFCILLGGVRVWNPLMSIPALTPQVPADSATTKQNRVPQQIPAPQRWRHNPEEGLCPPGTHISEDSRDCHLCSCGVDYTTHWNALSSCLPCTVCNAGTEYPRSNCTTTRNRECQCKPGTFRVEDSPEFCQKCRARCPDGMVEDRPCTPWSDLVCVHRGSGTKASGKAPAPGEFLTLTKIISHCVLQDHIEAEGSQRRKLLVPANGADPIDTLRLFFDYFPEVVPCKSWNPLMRLMGLTDNDIHVASASACSPEDTLYRMLVRWVSKKGRAASVHTLLEALDSLGERHAKETIEDHLVGSGKFIYLDGEAGSAMS